MKLRFVLSQTWMNLRRIGAMIVSVMLVAFVSFLFVGASAMFQSQIVKAESDWYDKVEVVVWLCPDGTSQSVGCSTGKSPSQQEIMNLISVIHNDLSDTVESETYVSKEQFFENTFLKKYPGGQYKGRTLTADDMQSSLRLKLKDPSKYKAVSEVLTNRDGVEKVVDQRQIFEPVFDVLTRATVMAVSLAAIMIFVAVLLTGTTIRMSAASRAEEMEIMRLVGASNWTIRMPFILEGAFASFIGSLLSCAALAVLVQTTSGWLSSSMGWIPFVDLYDVLLVSPFIIFGAILLSSLSSVVALRRYMKA